MIIIIMFLPKVICDVILAYVAAHPCCAQITTRDKDVEYEWRFCKTSNLVQGLYHQFLIFSKHERTIMEEFIPGVIQHLPYKYKAGLNSWSRIVYSYSSCRYFIPKKFEYLIIDYANKHKPRLIHEY